MDDFEIPVAEPTDADLAAEPETLAVETTDGIGVETGLV